jgi:hypothetical protein
VFPLAASIIVLLIPTGAGGGLTGVREKEWDGSRGRGDGVRIGGEEIGIDGPR